MFGWPGTGPAQTHDPGREFPSTTQRRPNRVPRCARVAFDTPESGRRPGQHADSRYGILGDWVSLLPPAPDPGNEVLDAVCGLLGFLTADVASSAGSRPIPPRCRAAGLRRVAVWPPPRARRARYLARRTHHPGLQSAVDHRHRALASAAALGAAGQPGALRAGVQQGRSTTTWNCASSCAPSTTRGSPPRATARRSSPPTTTGAPTRSRGCAACSPSRSGTPRRGGWSSRAIRSASSRCSWPPARTAPPTPARRRACWNCLRRWAFRTSWTCGRWSTTRCCSTCRSRSRCTRMCADWSPGATPRWNRVRRRRSHGTSSRSSGCGRSRRAARSGGIARSPRCWRIRSPSTCAPTSPSARSCPAVSTRQPSRRWRSGTIPIC